MERRFKTFRDHFLSIYQSAAADFARQLTSDRQIGLEGLGVEADDGIIAAAAEIAGLRAEGAVESLSVVGSTTSTEAGLEGMSAVDLARTCAALGLRYFEALALGDHATARHLKEDMPGSKCDPKWAKTLEDYVSYFGPLGTRRGIPYIRPAAAGNAVISIKPGSRVGIIGDWGTGAGPARAVLNQVKDHNPDILLHLGDIYYSGTPGECRSNFETVVNEILERPRTGMPVFTLAGNHDMYSGGEGYYDLISRLNPLPARQPASFFCLRTEDNSWQLVAMDTGLHDYGPFSVSDAVTFIEEDEEDWVANRVQEFPGKTILLSHHQLFSGFSAIGKEDADGRRCAWNPRLKAVLDRLQSSGKPISAWFWGHEHNLCVYEPYAGLKRGRCVGHSAIPVFTKDRPYDLLDGLVDPPRIVETTQLSASDSLYARGFATLALHSDGTAEVEYFENRNGSAVHVHREIID